MGFFDSLKKQLGRDTGRFISNKLFGNKHAIKYERVQNTDSNMWANTRKKTIQYEKERYEKEKEQYREQYKIQSKLKKEEFNREQYLKFIQKIENLIHFKIPTEKQALFDALYYLSDIISSNPWRNFLDERNRKLNIYPNLALEKYEQCLQMLKTKYPDSQEIAFFQKIYRRNQLKSFYQRFGNLIITIIFIIVGVIIILN